MSIFNQKSKFKVHTEVKKVKQAVAPTPPKRKATTSGTYASTSSATLTGSLSAPSSAHGTPRASPNPSSLNPAARRRLQSTSSPEPRARATSSPSSVPARKRRALPAKSRSPANASPALSESEAGSDDDDGWREFNSNKRRRRAYTEDPGRRLRHPEASDDGDGKLPIVHAVDVASLEDRCQPVMGLGRDEVRVRLRYPGSNYLERYELVWGKDKIDAAADIMKIVEFIASIYLTDAEAKPFLDQNNGIYRRLEKGKNTKDGNGFKAALRDFNDQLMALQKKGTIAKNIEAMGGVSRELAEFIITQVYDRTKISDIFDRTKLTSGMVFVDLGSGVGNVALQAALERGCESWGCEMMEHACNLAGAQKKEFTARCRLWGLAPGAVHLERGDFRKNEKTLAALKRADVVLVNNQAFTSELNAYLVHMFLDLKIGCKIVSLKTFVHDNKIAENDVASSILEVENLTYPPGYVSWTDAPGTYCISTRK
ncbi:Nucleosomal histone H3-Lys79 methylase [Collariella sp. IMI 366227]|nr:Nucleosomal histone H3-Lys79 methylase [Collariella sp. IMI 366227]